jgi:hypothetical protein
MEELDIIHCVGDSHASFFSGYDKIQLEYPETTTVKYSFFRSYRLGAVLAYNVNRTGTKEAGKEKFLQLLEAVPKNAKLLLCYGEIDCRCHLVKQALKQNLSFQSVVESCVNEYFIFVDKLLEKGYKVSLWNVIPSSNSDNNEFPTVGSIRQRNECTKIFNSLLDEGCKERGIAFISIQFYLMDKNFNTKSVYLFDQIHLGQIAMPYTIREIGKFFPESIYSEISPFRLRILILLARIKYMIKLAKFSIINNLQNM